VNRRAVIPRRPRERIGRLLGIRVAVAGRVHAADPRAAEARHDRAEVTTPEHTRFEPELTRDRQPFLEARHSRLIGGQREVAALNPLDVRAQLPLEAPPDPIGLHHQRHFERIAPLLPHESPVLPRLLPRDAPALDDDHPHAPPREIVRRRAPDDPRPHDDGVRHTLDHAAPIVRESPGGVNRRPA